MNFSTIRRDWRASADSQGRDPQFVLVVFRTTTRRLPGQQVGRFSSSARTFSCVRIANPLLTNRAIADAQAVRGASNCKRSAPSQFPNERGEGRLSSKEASPFAAWASR
jgi:hypothetical protein